MARNQCVPASDVGKSRLVIGLTSLKRYSFWAKFAGCLCMPFFCAGLACCVPAIALDDVKKKLECVVSSIYSPKVLHALRIKVDREQKIFMDACSNVIARTTPRFIIPRMTLIESIRATDRRIKEIVKDPSASFDLLIDRDTIDGRNQFKLDVYNEYVSLGGNMSVILYGLPEYMAFLVDPTSDFMMNLYSEVTVDSQLSRLMFEHKEKAGFKA